ncbi:MAG: PAS domain S-box protein [Anaerolineaceae bacterium]|nr:PAS domain S-box protein [Anaerolineaceae bacterium]
MNARKDKHEDVLNKKGDSFEELLQWEVSINQVLNSLSTALFSSDNDIKKIGTLILEYSRKVTGAEAGFVSMLENKSAKIIGLAHTQSIETLLSDQIDGDQIVFQKEKEEKYPGLWDFIINNRESLLINDPQEHIAWIQQESQPSAINNFLSVPILLDQGVLGQIFLANKANGFGERDLLAIQRIAAIFLLTLKWYFREEELEHQTRIIESANDAIITSDLDFLIDGWNQAAESMYGWIREEAIGNLIPDLLMSKYVNNTAEEIQKEFWEKGIWEGIVTHTTKKGNTIPVSVRVTILKDGQGNPVGVVSINRDISTEVQKEQALKASEANYKNLFNSMLDGFAVHEIICNDQGEPVDYRFLEVNPAFEALTGLNAAKILGKNVLEILPEIEKYWIETYGHVGLTGESIRFSHFSQAIGKYYLVYAFSNQPGQFTTVFTDITDLKETEMELARSEERFKAIVEDQVELISRFKKDGTPLYANPALCRFYEKSYDEVMRINVFKNIHEEDRHRVRKALDRLTPENPTNIHFNQMMLANGTCRDMRWSNRAIFDEYGNVVEYQSGGIDITEQRLAEKALQDNERLLLSIADNYPNSFLSIIEKDRTIGFSSGKEFVNQKLKPSDFLGLSLDDVFGEKSEFIKEQYEKVFNGEEISFEMFFNNQFQLYTVVPLRDTNEEISRILSVVENITERKKNEEELEKYRSMLEEQVDIRTAELEMEIDGHRRTVESLRIARDEAEAANRAKSAFLANMSHELRTPMNAILGYTQLMKRQSSFSEIDKSRLDTIIKSGGHLLGLINDVLVLSKIEAGKTSIQESTFFLVDMLQDLKNMFKLKAEEKGVDFFMTVYPGVPDSILTDATKLRQILVNLLGNAIKFTEKGKVSLDVDVEFLSGKNYLLKFKVEDTGKGIKHEDKRKVFEPFVQTQNDLKYSDGTGLGLPISNHFINLLGGTLELFSEPGKGSVFSFSIPVKLVDSEKVKETVLHDQILIGLEKNQPQYRILIVEDELANRELLFEGLESLRDGDDNKGFCLEQAENGKIAVELFQTWKPDLIFMDMRMPVMNGFQAIQKIRSLPGGNDVIIISLSASAFDEERLEILDSGCDAFLPKPYHENDLMKVLEKYLGVKFIYLNSMDIDSYTQSGIKDIEIDEDLIKEQIGMIGSGWLEKMKIAAISFDIENICSLAEDVEDKAPELSRFLKDRGENYDYRAILDILENS